MSINIQNLIHAIEQKQNSVSSALDVMQLSKAIDLLRLNKVFFIEKINALPSVNDVPSGTLYYIEEEMELYVLEEIDGIGKFWRNLGIKYGQLWAWGGGGSGQLGDGTVSTRSSPVSVIGGFTDWCQVSTGYSHTAAVRQNGSLWAWGNNVCGRLGDGTVSTRSSPVSVVGGFTDWCQVSAGSYHTAAVRTNGSLWAWGRGTFGRLGDNTTVNKSSPVSVVGEFTDWCQVSAGFDHTAAVRQNGTLWAWGCGVHGRLGDGTTTSKLSPVSVVGGFTDWCQVSAGTEHTAAVRQNGTLWAWGVGSDGRLGDGTAAAKCSPVSVLGGFTDWCQVQNFNAHTAAVRQNGSLWVWGSGQCGRLGDGTTVGKCSPVSVLGGFTDWCQVGVGCGHTAAVRTNGSLWAWGNGSSGRLGDNTIVDKCSPVSVMSGTTSWCQVSVGFSHTLALILKD